MYALVFLILIFLFPQEKHSFPDFIQRLKQFSVVERNTSVKNFLAEKKTAPIIENDSLLHFVWYGKAHSVIVKGDLQQGWSVPDTLATVLCGENTFFYRSYVVPPDSRLDYQFIVDGTWGTDPRNPKITPSGYGPHSEAAMPHFKSNPILVFNSHSPQGTIDSIYLKSKNDSIRPRSIKIYVPFGYKNLSDLSTLYVHDGFEALENELFKNVLDNMIASKKIQPVIVVFIPPIERGEEYVWIKLRDFTKTICDELVPLIDKTYHTAKNPARRATMGISNGGHVSLAIALKRPDVFLCAAGQSSTITPQLLEIFDSAVNHLSSHQPYKIYVDVGRYDLSSPQDGTTFLQSNRYFDQELKNNGIAHIYREFNDGHEWANWRERTEDILIYFFGKK